MSKSISEQYIYQSKSSILRNHINSLVVTITSINRKYSLKTQIGLRISEYEQAFRNYYSSDLIRSLCSGKDTSLSPLLDVGNCVIKQIECEISPLPERYEFKICEPYLNEVSRNMYRSNTDITIATYSFHHLINLNGDFNSFVKSLSMIIENLSSSSKSVRLNFMSSGKASNQFVCDQCANTLLEDIHTEFYLEKLKNFISRYSFDCLAVREISLPLSSMDGNCSVSKKIKPKLVVIFIDSLDKRIFKDESILERLPSLSRLFNSSDFFDNFTSSADWTYPVMHSIMYGISPALTMSIFRSFTPSLYSKVHKNIINDISAFMTFMQSEQEQIYSKVTFNGHLFTKLKRESIRTFCVRQSANLSWLYSLSAACNTSIERNENAIAGLHTLASKENIDNHLLWIDLDTLHRTDMPLSNIATSESFDFTYQSSSKARLIGGKNASDADCYLDKVKQIDYELGKILEYIDPNVPIILFSDHGSKALSNGTSKIKGTLTEDRVFNPSLLVSHSRAHKLNRITSLIESQDLHQIILHICGVDSILHSQIDIPIKEFYPCCISSRPEYNKDSFHKICNHRNLSLSMGSSTNNDDLILKCLLRQHHNKRGLEVNLLSVSFKRLFQIISKSNSNETASKKFFTEFSTQILKSIKSLRK